MNVIRTRQLQNFFSVAILVFSFICSFLTYRAETADPPDLEYRIKAAFLFNFAKFVDWPNHDASSTGPKAFTLCISGDNPFGDLLDTVSVTTAIKGKKVIIKYLEQPCSPEKCNIMYVGDTKPAQIKETLKCLGSDPILTVGESSNFNDLGGIIRFYLDNDRVKFEINREAAENRNLMISSQLLRLAKITRGAR